MDQKVRDEVAALTRSLMEAASCCSEAKAAAQRWLDALGTDAERAETQAYIEELEADIMPIEGLIAFAQSEKGAAVFGADAAANIAAHAREIQAAGARYCDCPACAAVEAILAHKEALLA